MDAERIVMLLDLLGCAHVRVRDKRVTCSCPLAPWTHGKGTDNRPAFGISIEPKARSRWRCLGCTRGGELAELLWALKKYTQRDYTQAFALVQTFNQEDFAALKDRIAAAGQRYAARPVVVGEGAPTELVVKPTSLPVMAALDEAELAENFVPIRFNSEGWNYLVAPRPRGRAVPRARVQEFIDIGGLRWQPDARRVAIPVRDRAGRLVGISGRTTIPGIKTKFLHSTGFHRDHVLYGIHWVRPTSRTGYVVEGQFDALWLRLHGYNGVAVLGSYISKVQVELFVQTFDRAVIVPDGDKAGAAAAARWQADLLKRLPTSVVAVPAGADPDELSAEILTDILGPPEGV